MGGRVYSGKRQAQQNNSLQSQVGWIPLEIGYLGAYQQSYPLRACHPLVLIKSQETGQRRQKEQKAFEAWQITSQTISCPCRNGISRGGYSQVGLALFRDRIQRRSTPISRADL